MGANSSVPSNTRLRLEQGHGARSKFARIQFDAALQMGQRQGGIAQFSGYPDFIVRLRTATAQCQLCRYFAENGHAQIQRPACGITPHQIDIILPCQRQKTCAELLQPGLVCGGQRGRAYAFTGDVLETDPAFAGTERYFHG